MVNGVLAAAPGRVTGTAEPTSAARRAHDVAAVEPLRRRMLGAAGWLVGSSVSSQALRLASNLLLTRLLLPEAFGLVAAVNTLYFALVMFSDLGVWQSVVRSERGADPRFLGTAWTVQIVRAALLAAAVALLALGLHVAAAAGAFAASTVYADPRLPSMMAAFGLCALIQGAESMKLASAQRELRGGDLARLELGAQLTATALTLALAWATRSVWSLVAGALAASLVRTVLSHVLLPGRGPRPAWDADSAREIVGFGKWIYLSSVVGFLAAHGEKLILGATLTSATFGLYSIAATLVAAVVAVYSSLNGHVVFSGLSQALRADRDALVRRYTRLQRLADLALGGVAGLLLGAGPWAVWLLYDERYQAAGAVLQCLGLGVIALRHQVLEQLMFARGEPAWVGANNALRAACLAALVPAGLAWAGERGAVAAVVLSQFASWPLSLVFKRREGLLSWATEAWWLPALLAGAGLGGALDAWLAALSGRGAGSVSG